MDLVEGLETRLLLSTWYVSPMGSDANPGSRVKPFQTIQHAADLAQPGDTVFLRRGTYREAVVSPTSGTAGAPIIFWPYKRETVTLDCPDPVGGWAASAPGTVPTPGPVALGDGKKEAVAVGVVPNAT